VYNEASYLMPQVTALQHFRGNHSQIDPLPLPSLSFNVRHIGATTLGHSKGVSAHTNRGVSTVHKYRFGLEPKGPRLLMYFLPPSRP